MRAFGRVSWRLLVLAMIIMAPGPARGQVAADGTAAKAVQARQFCIRMFSSCCS